MIEAVCIKSCSISFVIIIDLLGDIDGVQNEKEKVGLMQSSE
jgi:hypothetical protein